MLILPSAEVEERRELSFLIVGGPGVDGIEFGYRLGLVGLWAYYPIEGDFVAIASSVKELVERYLSGRLTV